MTEGFDIDAMSALTLAFVGDAVFTLYVRRTLALRHDYKSGELTKRAARLVSAVNQSLALAEIEKDLSQHEIEVLKRCRNAHTNNAAKNATAAQYHRATGLEGVIGYLYLKGNTERLEYILERCLHNELG